MDEEEDSACELRSNGASLTPDRLSEQKWRTTSGSSGLSSPAVIRCSGQSRPDSAIESQCSRQLSSCSLRSEPLSPHTGQTSPGYNAEQMTEVDFNDEDIDHDRDLSDNHPETLLMLNEKIERVHNPRYDHECESRGSFHNQKVLEHNPYQFLASSAVHQDFQNSQDSPEVAASDDEYILKQLPVQQAASVVQVQILEQTPDSDQEGDLADISTDQIDDSDLGHFRNRLSSLLDQSLNRRKLLFEPANGDENNLDINPRERSTSLTFDLHGSNQNFKNNESLHSSNHHQAYEKSIKQLVDDNDVYIPEEPQTNQSYEYHGSDPAVIQGSSTKHIVTLSEEEFARRTSALRQRIHNTFQLLCSIGAADGSELRILDEKGCLEKSNSSVESLPPPADHLASDTAPNETQNCFSGNLAISTCRVTSDPILQQPNSIQQLKNRPSQIKTADDLLIARRPPLHPPPPFSSVSSLSASETKLTSNPFLSNKRPSARSVILNQILGPVDTLLSSNELKQLNPQSNNRNNLETTKQFQSNWQPTYLNNHRPQDRLLHQKFEQSSSPVETTTVYERKEYPLIIGKS